VTLSGIIIVVNDEHPENELEQICVTDSGIVTFVNDVQPEKAPDAITVTEAPSVMSFIWVYGIFDLKRLTALLHSRVTDVNDVHPENA